MHDRSKDLAWLFLLMLLCAASLIAAVIVLSPATPTQSTLGATRTFAAVMLVPIIHRLTGRVTITAAFAVGVAFGIVGMGRHLDDPGVVPGLVVGLPIALLIMFRRPARRWIPLSSAMALTCFGVAMTFFEAPVHGARQAIAATLLDAPMVEGDPATHVEVSIDVARCANPVHVYVSATFPRVRRERVLPSLDERPGMSAFEEPFSGMTTIVPDARVEFTQESNSPKKTNAYWADWIERRGIGSCYLRVPELTGWAADSPYIRLGLEPMKVLVSGTIVIHTSLDVSHGPEDDVSAPSLTRRRCRDFTESCGADLVLTASWRPGFENVMLVVIGTLFSVLAQLAMRRSRRART